MDQEDTTMKTKEQRWTHGTSVLMFIPARTDMGFDGGFGGFVVWHKFADGRVSAQTKNCKTAEEFDAIVARFQATGEIN